MKMFMKGLVIAALATLAPLPAQADTTEINFGIISTESQQNLKQNWTPFLDAMAKQTGIKVNPFFASDYAGIIEARNSARYRSPGMATSPRMEAVDRADGQVFAQTVDVKATQGYWPAACQRTKTARSTACRRCHEMRQVALLREWRSEFHLGLPGPVRLRVCGKRSRCEDCFKAVTNANHETNLMAVANKQVDFATNNTENLACSR